MPTSPPPPEPRAELLPVEGSSAPVGARIDVGRELAIVLRETADQLQAMQEAQAQLTEIVADSASAEKTAESLRSLSYALKEMNDAQGQLAAELRGARRMGRLWLLVALVAAGIGAALVYSTTGLKDLQDSMREDRAVIADAAVNIRQELARRSRELAAEIDSLADQRQLMDDTRREELQQRLDQLRADYDQQIFAAESRLGDALRENQSLANSQKAMTDSLEQIGEEMQALRDSNHGMKQDLDRATGLLSAAEKQLDRRPAAPPPMSPGEISLTPPATESDPAPPPVQPPGHEDTVGRDLLALLVEEASKSLGLSVVGARATRVAGIFEDVVIEKVDDGRTSRRYSGQRLKLHVDLVRKKGILRIERGALTIFGWRGQEQFSRDVAFEEFDIQLDLLDADAWLQAGAAESGPGRRR